MHLLNSLTLHLVVMCYTVCGSTYKLALIAYGWKTDQNIITPAKSNYKVLPYTFCDRFSILVILHCFNHGKDTSRNARMLSNGWDLSGINNISMTLHLAGVDFLKSPHDAAICLVADGHSLMFCKTVAFMTS